MLRRWCVIKQYEMTTDDWKLPRGTERHPLDRFGFTPAGLCIEILAIALRTKPHS
jgi:hypothetical protein